MKRYIVTEDELNDLAASAMEYESTQSEHNEKSFIQASEACRARPVPDWANFFAANIDGPLDYGLYDLGNYEEIPE